ncbi:HEPN domain-containing protein [Fodinibius halophilus]|uniref:Uncharacterized protein n=1 Tax=Fodinibius halophilus TaxID=1736908 RepID=A0A6M1T7Q3_9BACT|nr:HEPN domain-containing protein [Fodinibius halophilus]NGP90287.1 hypothetical protein [Fodinibius halophilus]
MSTDQTNFFHFPILALVPDFEEEVVISENFSIKKRLWQTSTFDLATLQSEHDLSISYQIMDVFLSNVNLEISIKDVPCRDFAIKAFNALRLGLYVQGISPFLVPYISTHSINEYSGINSRDSKSLREELPLGLQEGITSDSATVSAWPMEMAFSWIVLNESLKVNEKRFKAAASFARSWMKLIEDDKKLDAIQSILISAPKILPASQSLLHLWSGIESMFPKVRSELSFRISLYLAVLLDSTSERKEIYDIVRDSYKLRSKITHGSLSSIEIDSWKQTWNLMLRAIKAIEKNKGLPKEDELLDNLLI